MLLALEYLHARQIIYRDVKPENTLVGADGHVLLSDFGISKRLHETSGVRAAASTTIGTPRYMPPEQYGGETYSYYVDLWAAAVMLHEVLTGEGIGDRSQPKLAELGPAQPMLEGDALDLLRRMLHPDRAVRLGCQPGAYDEIKQHPYYAGLDWEAVGKKAVPALDPADSIGLRGAGDAGSVRSMVRPQVRPLSSIDTSEIREAATFTRPGGSSGTGSGSSGHGSGAASPKGEARGALHGGNCGSVLSRSSSSSSCAPRKKNNTQ